MKIIGMATLRVHDEYGNLVQEIKDELNDICWPAWRRFFISNYNYNRVATRRDANNQNTAGARWQIFYGSKDIKPTMLNAWYSQDGVANVDQDTPYYTDGILPTDPDIMTFTAVIPAPTSSPRTIRVLGLTSIDEDTSSMGSSISDGKVTILRLSTPCIQAVNNTVSVTYRLYLVPATNSSDIRVNSRLYTDMKTVLKQACNAVNTRYINLGFVNQALTCTSYELDQLANLSLGGMQNSSGNQRGELTDKGLQIISPTRLQHWNITRLSNTYSVNDVASMGCFTKYLGMVGGGPTDPSGPVPRAMLYNDITPNVSSPVQNVFPQRNTPPGPFQDLTVNNTATMTGNITLGSSGWVDPLIQKLARINITATGAVGVATYKVSVANFTGGFVGNRWVTRTAILPQSLDGTNVFRQSANRKYHETGFILNGAVAYRTPDNYRYVVAACNRRIADGINVYDVIKGDCISLNAANGLNVTAVSDMAVSNGYTFVTCADTGLWRISPDFLTIENIPSPTGTDKAYQISSKNDIAGTIWVLFDGGLCKLTNPTAALGSLTWSVHNPTTGSPTFTYTGITDNNWDKVVSMTIDPDNASDNQFLLMSSVMADATNSNRKGFIWWSTGTGSAVNPGTNGVSYSGNPTWNTATLLNSSDSNVCTGGRWYIPSTHGGTPYGDNYIYHFPFGTSDLSATQLNDTAYVRAIPAEFNGIKGIMTSDAYNTTNAGLSKLFVTNTTMATIPNNATVNLASIYTEFMFRQGPGSYVTDMESAAIDGVISCPLVYLKDSNLIFGYEKEIGRYSVTPFMLSPSHAKYNTYRAAFWKDYGWDGGAWVLNNAGSKPTHATAESLSMLDGLDISFTDGVTGTSFVNNEFWSAPIGKGLMKDNGVTFTSNFSFSLYPTKPLVISDNVPQTPLGALVDEPVTFTPRIPDYNYSSDTSTETTCIQNKGTLVTHPAGVSTNYDLVSNQLIPNGTPFDFRFKWISYEGNPYAEYFNPEIGTATGTTSFTWGIKFRYNSGTNVLEIYNNASLLASISNPSIDAECRITRDASNNVISYYNGVAQHAAVVTSSAMVIFANGNTGAAQAGWHGMMLTYTENRRVLRLGNQGLLTGSYDPKFSGLTHTGLANDTKVYVGSGSPLQMTLDYTPSSNPIAATGTVKVATGCGWLIFHNSEASNPVTGSTVVHYVP